MPLIEKRELTPEERSILERDKPTHENGVVITFEREIRSVISEELWDRIQDHCEKTHQEPGKLVNHLLNQYFGVKE
jgi:hypothetical protein